jgi:hypothetical protein
MDRLVVFDVGLFVLDHPAENAEKLVRNVVDYELLRLPLLPRRGRRLETDER